jgi:hypothetical protein
MKRPAPPNAEQLEELDRLIAKLERDLNNARRKRARILKQ